MAKCTHDGPRQRVVYEEPGEPTIGPYEVIQEYCKRCGEEIPYANPKPPEDPCPDHCGSCDEKHRVWEAKLETAEAAARSLQDALEAMTEDRDLWQGDHNQDCPNLPEKCCSICAEPTEMACSDCRSDFGVTIYVCPKDQAEHEKKCSARLRERIDHALADMTTRLKRLQSTQGRFRLQLRDRDAAGCARAVAELTAVSTLLLGNTSFGAPQQYPNLGAMKVPVVSARESEVNNQEETKNSDA